MATNTVTPVQGLNQHCTNFTNKALTLSLPGKPRSGSTDSNQAKESFFLLDLFQEVKNVITTLGEFNSLGAKLVLVHLFPPFSHSTMGYFR